jgi:hypothetical protein
VLTSDANGNASWTGVASGQGMFKARHSTNQALSTTTETAVNFNTALFNPDNAYSTTTSEFTAPATGYYHFDIKLAITGSATVTNQPFILRIYQNSTLIDQVSTYTSYNTSPSYANGFPYGTNLSLDAGDKVSVRVIPTVTTLSLSGGASSASTTFSGYRIR